MVRRFASAYGLPRFSILPTRGRALALVAVFAVIGLGCGSVEKPSRAVGPGWEIPPESRRAPARQAPVVKSSFAEDEAGSGPRHSPAETLSAVTINGVQLTAAELARLEAMGETRIPAGSYWYDSVSGAWGFAGGPARGFAKPELLGRAPLRASASGGGDGNLTGVYVNGREIHPLDLAALKRLVPLGAGRYWFDCWGNTGREGEPPFTNLFEAARRANDGSLYAQGPKGWIGSEGGTSYYVDPENGAGGPNVGASW